MEYVIYIDGSFNTKTNKGGYGLVITKGEEILYEELGMDFGECK